MRFTNSELEMIYQYAAPTKAETISGMKETVPVIKDLLTSCKRYQSRSAASLSPITNPVSLRGMRTLSGGGLLKQRHSSQSCRGMT